MAAGLPDRVDCLHLADDAAVLQRVYELGELPRLQDLLADVQGAASASFAFESIGAGRTGATVCVKAKPNLVCQRCLQGFPFEVAASSEVEFASSEAATPVESRREIYVMDRGRWRRYRIY